MFNLKRAMLTAACTLPLCLPAAAATCDYEIANDWGQGFQANIRITNSSTETIEGWTVYWQYSDGSSVSSSWNAVLSATDGYSATNLNWNATIAAGQSVEFGITGSNGASSAEQVVITGAVCDESGNGGGDNGGGDNGGGDNGGGDNGGGDNGGGDNGGGDNGGGDNGASMPDQPITALEAAALMGTGFNLGQMFDNDQHSPTLTAASKKIDAYYAEGFRNVRIPVSWTISIGGSALVDNSGTVKRDHPRLQELINTVDHALSYEDMFVVINAHHEAAIKDGNNAAMLEQLWSDISDIFKDRSHRLIFQVLNEPHLSGGGAMSPGNLRHMTGLAYDKIRANTPTRIVVIGGNQWFGAHEMAISWPNLDAVGGGDDSYLMASFHHYNPWSFHGQGNHMTDWNSSHLEGPFSTMQNWANGVGQGMPIYISEWGTDWGQYKSAMDCNNIRAWYQALAEHARLEGIPTSVWDDGGWFMIFSHASNSYNNNLYQCAIGGSCNYSAADSSRFNAACN